MMKKYKINELTRGFVELDHFIEKWKSLGLNDDDLFELEIMLMQTSKEHPVIQGTGGLRKVRFSPERLNKGKSGAYRIIYLDLDQNEIIVLLVAYSKNDQDSLSAAEKSELKQLVELLKSLYGRKS